MFRGPSTPILRENTTDEINITNYNIGFKLTNILVLVLAGLILGLECPGAKTVYDMSSKNTGLYCLRCILQLNSR